MKCEENIEACYFSKKKDGVNHGPCLTNKPSVIKDRINPYYRKHGNKDSVKNVNMDKCSSKSNNKQNIIQRTPDIDRKSKPENDNTIKDIKNTDTLCCTNNKPPLDDHYESMDRCLKDGRINIGNKDRFLNENKDRLVNETFSQQNKDMTTEDNIDTLAIDNDDNLQSSSSERGIPDGCENFRLIKDDLGQPPTRAATTRTRKKKPVPLPRKKTLSAKIN